MFLIATILGYIKLNSQLSWVQHLENRNHPSEYFARFGCMFANILQDLQQTVALKKLGSLKKQKKHSCPSFTISAKDMSPR